MLHWADSTTSAAMEGSGEVVTDKRWSFEEEIAKVLERSVKQSFPDEEDLKWAEGKLDDCDYECQNVLTVWSNLVRHKYPDINSPQDIGRRIMKNLLNSAPYMIRKAYICDVGFVSFSLSREWLTESIHKMLKDGIDTWAPILPVERVVVDFPSLDDKISLGCIQQSVMGETLSRMLQYSKVNVYFDSLLKGAYTGNLDSHIWIEHEHTAKKHGWQTRWKSQISIKEKGSDVVIYVKNKPPFILAKRDFDMFYIDLESLRSGINELKADWMVYLTPVRQQEYIEMCFTAAELEGWIKYKEGTWSPLPGRQYPVLTYAGYRAYSTKEEELVNSLDQLKARCIEVARGADAMILGYTPTAVLSCVIVYTFLKSHRLADCSFDSDEMVKEEGNTFVYLLRIRAEVHRITSDFRFRKGIDELKNASDLILEKYEGYEECEERLLEFHLLRFTEVLKKASLFVLPHMMCKYLYDLSEKFKSCNDFVHKTGSVAKTRRLLLYEATAVVIEKCFHLLGITTEVVQNPNWLPLLCNLKSSYYPSDVQVGVEPDNKKQKMAEREQMDETRHDPEFVNSFITPCSVSYARDPFRNSRFELFSIRPFITGDSMFETCDLFGLISVPDNYGLRIDGGYPLFEPDFSYVSLFEHVWCDPIKMRHGELIYLDNPSSHHSVPFSSSIQIHMELYASTEKKDACFQLCDDEFELDLGNIWGEPSDSLPYCCGLCAEGEDGKTLMYYILVKDAADATVEANFTMNNGHKVHGEIFAYYGDEFYYDGDPLSKNCYRALLYSSYHQKPGRIPLKRSGLAVPKNVSLIIEAQFVDVETQKMVLFHKSKFPPATKEGSSVVIVDGTGCTLELQVVWKL